MQLCELPIWQDYSSKQDRAKSKLNTSKADMVLNSFVHQFIKNHSTSQD